MFGRIFGFFRFCVVDLKLVDLEGNQLDDRPANQFHDLN